MKNLKILVLMISSALFSACALTTTPTPTRSLQIAPTIAAAPTLPPTAEPMAKATLVMATLAAPTPMPTGSSRTFSFAYGAVFPVPYDRADARFVGEFRAELTKLRALDINLIALGLMPDTTPNDWQVLLNAAWTEGLAVIPTFYETVPQWQGKQYDLKQAGAFLTAMKDHPALFGYFVVDEPYHQRHNNNFDAERLRVLYQQVKSLAPNVRVLVQWSREIEKAEEKYAEFQRIADDA